MQRPDPARWGEIVLNILPFEPVVDGDVLPGPPLERIAAGSAAGVDVLVGSNRHEYRFFFVPSGVADRADEALLAAVAAGYRLAPAALERYRAASSGATPGLSCCPTSRPTGSSGSRRCGWPNPFPAATSTSSPGSRRSAASAPATAWRCPSSSTRSTTRRVAPLAGPVPPSSLAGAVHGAWVAFAATGDPGWPAYTPDRRAVARFGNGDDPGWEVVEDPRGDLRELWDGIR